MIFKGFSLIFVIGFVANANALGFANKWCSLGLTNFCRTPPTTTLPTTTTTFPTTTVTPTATTPTTTSTITTSPTATATPTATGTGTGTATGTNPTGTVTATVTARALHDEPDTDGARRRAYRRNKRGRKGFRRLPARAFRRG